MLIILYNWVVPKSLSAQLPKNGSTIKKIMRKTKSKNQEYNTRWKIITRLHVSRFGRLMILKKFRWFAFGMLSFMLWKKTNNVEMEELQRRKTCFCWLLFVSTFANYMIALFCFLGYKLFNSFYHSVYCFLWREMLYVICS